MLAELFSYIRIHLDRRSWPRRISFCLRCSNGTDVLCSSDTQCCKIEGWPDRKLPPTTYPLQHLSPTKTSTTLVCCKIRMLTHDTDTTLRGEISVKDILQSIEESPRNGSVASGNSK